MAKKKIKGEETVSYDTIKNEASFAFSDIGAKSRVTYSGPFTVKTGLTPDEILASGRDLRDFLGQHAQLAPDHEYNLALALSQLKQRVIKGPAWWYNNGSYPGSHIPDKNILVGIFDLALKSEEGYTEVLKKESEKLFEKLSSQIDKAKALEKEISGEKK